MNLTNRQKNALRYGGAGLAVAGLALGLTFGLPFLSHRYGHKPKKPESEPIMKSVVCASICPDGQSCQTDKPPAPAPKEPPEYCGDGIVQLSDPENCIDRLTCEGKPKKGTFIYQMKDPITDKLIDIPIAVDQSKGPVFVDGKEVPNSSCHPKAHKKPAKAADLPECDGSKIEPGVKLATISILRDKTDINAQSIRDRKGGSRIGDDMPFTASYRIEFDGKGRPHIVEAIASWTEEGAFHSKNYTLAYPPHLPTSNSVKNCHIIIDRFEEASKRLDDN